MTDPLTDRLTSAAEHAMRGADLRDPRDDVVPGAAASSVAPRRRRWMTASAAALAAAVAGLVVWVAMQDGSHPDPVDPAATTVPSRTRAASDALADAVAASLAAPAWSAEISSAAGETFWIYQAPDRVEMRTGGPTGGWEPASVTVGTDMYVFEQGEWTLQQQDWRTSAALNLLEDLNRVECAAREGDAIVYWRRPPGDCGAPTGVVPVDLPATSEVGRVELDGSDRIRSVRVAEILEVDGQRVIRPDPEAEGLLERVGATGGATATYRYDDVPPVTVPSTG